jgi:hypothetical protein
MNSYGELPNKWIAAADGINYAFRECGTSPVPLVLLQHFRGNLDSWAGRGLDPEVQEATTCCYAVQDKAWVDDPDGAPWEFYTVLADAPEETGLGCSTESCLPEAVTVYVAESDRSCC